MQCTIFILSLFCWFISANLRIPSNKMACAWFTVSLHSIWINLIITIKHSTLQRFPISYCNLMKFRHNSYFFFVILFTKTISRLWNFQMIAHKSNRYVQCATNISVSCEFAPQQKSFNGHLAFGEMGVSWWSAGAHMIFKWKRFNGQDNRTMAKNKLNSNNSRNIQRKLWNESENDNSCTKLELENSYRAQVWVDPRPCVPLLHLRSVVNVGFGRECSATSLGASTKFISFHMSALWLLAMVMCLHRKESTRWPSIVFNMHLIALILL